MHRRSLRGRPGSRLARSDGRCLHGGILDAAANCSRLIRLAKLCVSDRDINTRIGVVVERHRTLRRIHRFSDVQKVAQHGRAEPVRDPYSGSTSITLSVSLSAESYWCACQRAMPTFVAAKGLESGSRRTALRAYSTPLSGGHPTNA